LKGGAEHLLLKLVEIRWSKSYSFQSWIVAPQEC